jgi:hypothetical protein
MPPVSLTPVANLELRISPRIFEKILNGLNGILWGWGETDSWKDPEAKNLVPLNSFRVCFESQVDERHSKILVGTACQEVSF